MRKLFLVLISLLITVPQLVSQTTEDYKKAGWMTTRMYGGNRSGYGPNWLTMDFGRGYDFVKDADGSYDLTGGWHDCGDHVKFGQTQFYSGYMLLLGYSAFPEGYDDYYSPDYSGYRTANNFTWEGGAGTPNNIPDILDEVKYATDYFIKCARDGSTFYSQVGNGDFDHKNWITSVSMAQLSINEGGEASGSRAIKKNPNDASMASFCGAALALMSRVYRPFDEAYADKCLTHAVYAYEYASSHQTNADGGTISGSYYGPDNKWEDNYVCLCAELYWATGDNKYKTEALSYSADVINHGWVLDFENNDDIAAYALAKLGDTHGETVLNELATDYIGAVNGNDCIEVGSSWGVLRYSCSAAFVVALNQAYKNETTIHSALKGTMDYVMGFNSANQSFIVGFGNDSPKKPHHRNIFLEDGGNNIPSRNQQHGYLVGGSHNPSSFPDLINNYQTSEGGIDYNSGLVGSLGYIRSILDPVDQSKFGLNNCTKPNLGADKSLCGIGEITLNANITTANRTISWQLDGNTISGSGSTINVTQGGTYTVLVDSSGCVTSDNVLVSAEIPNIDLGGNKVYNGSPLTLDAGIDGNALSFVWSFNGSTISGASSSTYDANKTGIFSVTVSGAGCDSKSDEIVISKPPSFSYTNAGVTIDGTKDARFVDEYSIETLLAGNAGVPNLYGTWSGLWDATNMYLFISIVDNALYNDSGNTWYADDGVEVFIDGGNEKATNYDGNDFQLGFIWDRTAVIEGGNNVSAVSGVNYTIAQTTNGYNIEIEIPWSTLNTTPAIGKTIGFDIGINDDDDGAGRENKISWFQTVDDGWQNPSVFGEITLLESSIDLAPEIDAGTDITVTLPINAINLSASATDDGSIENIVWTQTDGLSQLTISDASSLTTSITDLVTGTYIFQLSVTDDAGNTSIDFISITIEAIPPVSQTISLTEGWNFISFYVIADDMSIGSVFSNILGNIEIIKNSDGFYLTGISTELQSLNNIEIGKGYLVKTNAPGTVILSGEAVVSYSYQLQAGWNMLGYPYASSSDIATTVSGISGDIVVIKNFEGSYETGGLNGITNFDPGCGYYIQTNSANTLNW